MKEEFSKIHEEILNLTDKENIVSVLIYGTAITDEKMSSDLDIIIVFKEVNANMNSLLSLFLGKYPNLDLNIYSYEEILNDLSFYTREFKLEYIAKGLCIYGDNIFIKEFSKVDKFRYRQSILIRSIEHLQMVRQKYFSGSLNNEQKFKYMRKYFLRISKNILLFHEIGNHTYVNNLNSDEIFRELVKIKAFAFFPDLDSIKTSDEYFDLFNLIISRALIKCKQDFN